MTAEICSDFGQFILVDGLEFKEEFIESVAPDAFEALEREASMVICAPSISVVTVFANGIHDVSIRLLKAAPKNEPEPQTAPGEWHHIEDFPFNCGSGVVGRCAPTDPPEQLLELQAGKYAFRFYAREIEGLGFGEYALDIWPSEIADKATVHHTKKRGWGAGAT